MKLLSPLPGLIADIDGEVLTRAVRSEQLVAVRRSLRTAIPINIAMSFTVALVAFNFGHALEGLAWLALSLAVSASRVLISRRAFAPPPGVTMADDVALAPGGHPVERHLRVAAASAAASGCVWALVPWLCAGYTAPETIFYLTVVCGICAGSVIYGIAYAWVSISFITPTLLSVFGCLVYAGGFDRISLAAMVLLYLAALVRGARHSEAAFRHGSRMKNEATAMASMLRDAHELTQASSQELVFRAAHDSLSGLLNRDGFTTAANRRLAAEATERHCMMLLDLDGFKAVNDGFGHKIGDRVLQDVSAWLRRELTGIDATLGRWGGDEFVVLFRIRDEQRPVHQIAESLIGSISTATAHYGGHLGVSIGICVSQDHEVLDMISYADEALYDAKRAGRNRYQFVDDALNVRLAVRRDVERDLLTAIDTRAITMWYQPIVNCADGRLHSLEALLRWHHPRHGPVSPERVVSAAASTGLAENLTRHILSEICLTLQLLDRTDSPLRHVPISMNISPREMAQLAVDDIVLGMLDSHALPARRLQIEITEEVALDTQATHGRLSRLASAGVAIVVDDFGAGYSSFASLRSAFVQQVKIDRMFTADLLESPVSAVLIDSIVKLGRALDIEVVAEGVETQEQLAALRGMGCPLAQGYHLARPAPLPDIMAWATRLP